MRFLALGLYLGQKVRVMQNKTPLVLYDKSQKWWKNPPVPLNCLPHFSPIVLIKSEAKNPEAEAGIGHKDVILLFTYCTYIY